MSSTVQVEAPIDPQFLDKRLAKIPDGLNWRQALDHDSPGVVMDEHGPESTSRTPFATFLTKLSHFLRRTWFLFFYLLFSRNDIPLRSHSYLRSQSLQHDLFHSI